MLTHTVHTQLISLYVEGHKHQSALQMLLQHLQHRHVMDKTWSDFWLVGQLWNFFQKNSERTFFGLPLTAFGRVFRVFMWKETFVRTVIVRNKGFFLLLLFFQKVTANKQTLNKYLCTCVHPLCQSVIFLSPSIFPLWFPCASCVFTSSDWECFGF